jgi:hypothetical protein
MKIKQILKSAFSSDDTSCSPLEFTNVSEEHIISIFSIDK